MGNPTDAELERFIVEQTRGFRKVAVSRPTPQRGLGNVSIGCRVQRTTIGPCPHCARNWQTCAFREAGVNYMRVFRLHPPSRTSSVVRKHGAFSR